MASADPDPEAVTPSNVVTTEHSMVTSTAPGGEVTQHEGVLTLRLSGHMECSIYQNYTASEVLVQGLAGVVNQVSHDMMMMMMIVRMMSG